jgi:hypothetical protein
MKNIIIELPYLLKCIFKKENIQFVVTQVEIPKMIESTPNYKFMSTGLRPQKVSDLIMTTSKNEDYNLFKEWYDVTWNDVTENIISKKITVIESNKDDIIYQQTYCNNCRLIDLKYTDEDNIILTFNVDYFNIEI